MYSIFLLYLRLVHTAQAKLPNKRVSLLLPRITMVLDGVYYRTDDVNRNKRCDNQMMINIQGTKAKCQKRLIVGTWMEKEVEIQYISGSNFRTDWTPVRDDRGQAECNMSMRSGLIGILEKDTHFRAAADQSRACA